MKGDVRVKIKGLEALEKKLTPALVKGPATRLMNKYQIWTTARATELAPRGVHGGLRGSMSGEVIFQGPLPHETNVGTNLFYGPYQELGTGLLTVGAGGSGKRHHPPAAALQTWASNRGTTGSRVAWIIAARGGLRPQLFLTRAQKEVEPKVQGWVATMAQEIEMENRV